MERKQAVVLEEYLDYLTSQKIKPVTAQAYTYDISLYLKYMKNRIYRLEEVNIDLIDISDVDIKLLSKISDVDLISYKNYLDKVRQNRGAARARKISSLKSFYHFIVYIKRYLDVNPCDQLEMPKRVKKSDSSTENLLYDDILEFIQGIHGTNHLRDKAILFLILDTSISLQELIHLTLKDVDFEKDEMNVGFNQEDIKKIPIKTETKMALQDYINLERIHADCDYLFLSQRKNQMSPRTIQHIIKTRANQDSKLKGKVSAKILKKVNMTN